MEYDLITTHNFLFGVIARKTQEYYIKRTPVINILSLNAIPLSELKINPYIKELFDLLQFIYVNCSVLLHNLLYYSS